MLALRHDYSRVDAEEPVSESSFARPQDQTGQGVQLRNVAEEDVDQQQALINHADPSGQRAFRSLD